jgi:hypothetical protein
MTQKNIIITNKDNYKNSLKYSSIEYIKKYLLLINEYLAQCAEKIIFKNKNYHHLVITRGLNTLEHIFCFLLLYTKNIELTHYHTHKSLYYYIEFISQIGDNNNSFLQLNSTDAVLFILKKTLFDIELSDADYSEDDSTKINNIKIYIQVLNEYISNELYNNIYGPEFNSEININFKFIQYINSLYVKCNNETIYGEWLELCYNFIKSIKKLENNNTIFLQFLKKITNKELSIIPIKERIDKPIYNEYKLMSANKMINWLCN